MLASNLTFWLKSWLIEQEKTAESIWHHVALDTLLMIRALFPELPLVQSTKHVRCILKTSMFQPFGNPNALYVGEVWIQFKINSTISGTIKLTRRTKPKWIYPAEPKSFRPKEILHTWIVSSSVFIVFVPFPEGTKMYEPNIVWGIN